ncbi:MAG: hypothetical protein ACRC1W_01300 [Shewanella sp.]
MLDVGVKTGQNVGRCGELRKKKTLKTRFFIFEELILHAENIPIFDPDHCCLFFKSVGIFDKIGFTFDADTI